MSKLSEKIKVVNPTQVLVQQLNLNEFLEKDISKELSDIFAEDGELIVSLIQFQIVPKHKETEKKLKIRKGEKMGIKIDLSEAKNLVLEHPSFSHYKDKVVQLTSNNSLVLKKLLE